MPLTKSIVEIDGSYLEGGGQILRNALSFSCILGRPVRVTNIRANRPNPGLSNQHLCGINLLANLTGAKVTGNHIKSTQIEFFPGDIKSGKHFADTGTAGSVALVLQAALPVLLFGNSSSQLELVGGTNVGMAPQVDFMTEVLRPNLEQFGVSFDFDLERRGYYPRGGGRCRVYVPSLESINPVNMTHFGVLSKVEGWCYVAGRLPLHLAVAMKNIVEKELRNACPGHCSIEAYKESKEIASDNGSGLILKATTSEGRVVGASGLGSKDTKVEDLAACAVSELRTYIENKTCVDQHVQDQLIVYMALAKGLSRIHTCSATKHTRTAIYVAELMTGVDFRIEQLSDTHVAISCTGIGYSNRN